MEGPSLVPDRFRGMLGPCHPGKDFESELTRIDNRLVLRWQPYWQRYAVFSKFTEGKLWSQPTHVIETSDQKCYRRPDHRDLRAIQYAKYMFDTEGSSAWERHLDKVMKAEADSGAEATHRTAQAMATTLCHKYDLTSRKLRELVGEMF